MRQILDDLKRGLDNPTHKRTLHQMFEEYDGKIEIDEFFDFVIDELGSKANEDE
jgi:hypothetical protein